MLSPVCPLARLRRYSSLDLRAVEWPAYVRIIHGLVGLAPGGGSWPEVWPRRAKTPPRGYPARRAGDRRAAHGARAGDLLLGARRRPDRPRPAVVGGDADRGARRRGAARDRAHPHPPRPRGRDGLARAPLARHAGLRPRARRAAPDRPVEAVGERRAAVGRHGRALGRGRAGPGGEHHARRRRRHGVRHARRLHARPRLPPRLLPARGRAAGRSSATWPACACRRSTTR